MIRKRVRRLYRLEGLELRMRVRRRKHIALHRDQRPSQQASPSAGAQTLSMIPGPMGARFGSSRWWITGGGTVLCKRQDFG